MPYQRGMTNTRKFDPEMVSRALRELGEGSLAKSLARISPAILAELRVPNERALMPYTPVEDELKAG